MEIQQLRLLYHKVGSNNQVCRNNSVRATSNIIEMQCSSKTICSDGEFQTLHFTIYQNRITNLCSLAIKVDFMLLQ